MRAARQYNNLTYIYAWKVVLTRNLLSTQMLLHGERVVRTTLDGGIINNNNTLTAGNPANACDHSGTWDGFGVHFVCSQGRQL